MVETSAPVPARLVGRVGGGEVAAPRPVTATGVAGIASLTAGLAHLALLPGHADHGWAFTGSFAGAGVALALSGGWLAWRGGERARRLVLAVCVATAAAFAVAHTVGLPGPLGIGNAGGGHAALAADGAHGGDHNVANVGHVAHGGHDNAGHRGHGGHGGPEPIGLAITGVEVFAAALIIRARPGQRGVDHAARVGAAGGGELGISVLRRPCHLGDVAGGGCRHQGGLLDVGQPAAVPREERVGDIGTLHPLLPPHPLDIVTRPVVAGPLNVDNEHPPRP